MSTRSASTTGEGRLARAVRRAAGASARRPKSMIVLWLVFVATCVTAGAMVGTKSLTDSEAGVGESARGDARIAAAGLESRGSESVLVRSPAPATTRAAAAALGAS